jgi:hypothetical protein
MMKHYPFQFTGRTRALISIEEMGFNSRGICPLDSPVVLGVNKRHAFSNLSLRAVDPVDCFILVYARGCPILAIPVTADMYIKTNLKEGPYLLNLNMQMFSQPIMLGFDFIPYTMLSFGIVKNLSMSTYMVRSQFDINFVVSHFTHAIIELLSVDTTAYDWDQYCVNPDIINVHRMLTIPFVIQKRDMFDPATWNRLRIHDFHAEFNPQNLEDSKDSGEDSGETGPVDYLDFF